MQRSQLRSSRTIIETALVLLLLLALLAALYDVLKVFFGVFTFALIFYVSMQQPYEQLVRLLNQRRKLAAVLYSILLILIVALPFIYVVAAPGRHVRNLLQIIDDVRLHGLPNLPDRMATMPYLGEPLSDFWKQLQEDPREALAGYQHQARVIMHHLLAGGAGILSAALQVLLGIITSAFMLVSGDKVVQPLRSILQHLLGRRDGLSLIYATAHAIRGVSIGVMGTAFIAAMISWIGFAIAGLHFKVLLAALVFFLVLIQVGPLIVWVPLVIWAAVQGYTGTAIFLAIYGGGVLLADAVLKPVLIAKSGGRLPFLVLFCGVVGGLAAWGFTGMFKGAIILAVFYTVLTSWLERKQGSEI
ncbi:AI-2E family transporter [uncultured Chitinophaga sp.]|jgi:Predicted permease|uniref:AI-2E family transporter n=1 Tax=uncultured Chitinophaga sp. TaxID=339340 RepID=UPI0026267ECE|nr:AI-2E family transporter [uncultured Chitinophaga sp.]